MPWPINPDAPMNPIAAMLALRCRCRRIVRSAAARAIGADASGGCRLHPGDDLRRLHGARLALDLACRCGTAPASGCCGCAKRDDACGLASLSTLASTASPFSWRAACSNCGAIARHGPHHAAQKSTTTGSSLRRDEALEARIVERDRLAVEQGGAALAAHRLVARAASSRLAALQSGRRRSCRSLGTCESRQRSGGAAVRRCGKVPPRGAVGPRRSGADERAQQAEAEVAADRGDDERLDDADARRAGRRPGRRRGWRDDSSVGARRRGR